MMNHEAPPQEQFQEPWWMTDEFQTTLRQYLMSSVRTSDPRFFEYASKEAVKAVPEDAVLTAESLKTVVDANAQSWYAAWIKSLAK